MDMRRLDGKVLMVTGATRGIGLAAAERLGAEGARLVLTARTEDDGRDVEAKLRAAGTDAVFVAADVTDVDGPVKVVETAVARPRSTTWAASWRRAGRLMSTRPAGRLSWSSTSPASSTACEPSSHESREAPLP
jgi:NAD(P)-dependent dehydrogenase (short-subunit alcohol dehydrogenase family)